MASLGGFFLNLHTTQFDGSVKADENCGPATAANGARASSGGKVNKTGKQIRALIPRWQETNPGTPGWSLGDIDHAMAKIGVGFVDKSGSGWGVALSYLNAGNYLAMQGDSDQFSNATCSGAFNGDHCLGIHPAKITTPHGRMRWIDDPICKTGRWEFEAVIFRYGAKLNPSIQFGVFTTKVPLVAPQNLIDSAPASIGPQPSGATSWVETDHLARLWVMDIHGIVRPIFNEPNDFNFQAWAGPNISEMWAPGPSAPQEPDKQVFRRILAPVHTGLYIRVTDAGSAWHRD